MKYCFLYIVDSGDTICIHYSIKDPMHIKCRPSIGKPGYGETQNFCERMKRTIIEHEPGNSVVIKICW